jgi:imidazolonepropionase-like amidohydrolase
LDVNRILFVNGQVFDGTGAPAVPADVVVLGDRIERVRAGGGTEIEPGDQVVDCTGATVMPGLVESHSHLTFPSAVGHIDSSFNPPLDVSFFHHMPTPDQHLQIARRNAKILLERGFTSAYSAGSLTPVPTEVRLREEIAAGTTPGPRMRASSFERDNNPVQMGPDGPKPKKAEKMGSVKALRAMTELYPELRKRGLRVLPGGDYGFPNNPIGRNARDLSCSSGSSATPRPRRCGPRPSTAGR